MPRLLVAALPLIAGLLPLSAWPLGLGEITLGSALNQPFRAEIPVTADSAEELSRLEVTLAPRDTFQRFGLDRPAFLGEFRFVVEPAGAGGGVLRITSSRPVTEPFVTLLIEARWPAGRLLREYTVLLDPPAFVADEGRGPEALPAAPSAVPAETIRRADPPPPASPAAPPSAPRPAMAVAGSSYEVRRADTLWQVASELRPDPSVSVNQMMIALFRANPEAFAGNINRLRAGAILRVPGADELRGLPSGEANSEVARQNTAWRGDQGARLQLVPPAELPPPGPASASGAGDSAQLQSRVGQLERELAEARRLLSVRDDELGALQAQLSGQVPAVREEPVTPLPPVEPFVTDAPALVDEAFAEPAEAVVDEPVPAITPAVPDAGRTVVRPEPPARGSLLDTILGLLTSVWLWGAAAVVVALSLFLLQRRRQAAEFGDEEETGRWSAPREPTIPPATAVAGAAAAGGFIVEERPALAVPAPDSTDQTLSEPALRLREEPAAEVAAVMGGGDGASPTDVVAEADFHMAYGLYDQAADLLNTAIAAEPVRRDLRMKLLEVLFVWENKGAFLRAAQELGQRLDTGSDPDWAKIMIMGQQICPEDPMFAGARSAAVGDDLDFALDSEEGAGTVDFSIDETGSQQTLGEFDPGDAEADLDFDVGEAVSDSGQATTSVATVIDTGRTMEAPTIEARFGGDSPTMESPTLEVPSGSSPTMETPTIQTRSGWPAEGDEPEPTQAIDLDELGLDFSGLDEAADALSTGLHQALDEATGTGMDEFLGEADETLLAESGVDAGFEFDLSESREDLESAYEDESVAGGGTVIEPTADMPGLASPRGNQELDIFADAMGGGRLARNAAGDTAEHPQIDETAAQLLLDAEGDVDFDIGDTLVEEDFEPTASLVAESGRLGGDGPTMTEVGTKLDLARAYIDMGDPDGARSILNEVLEEGDAAQRQEARQLLSELAD